MGPWYRFYAHAAMVLRSIWLPIYVLLDSNSTSAVYVFKMTLLHVLQHTS